MDDVVTSLSILSYEEGKTGGVNILVGGLHAMSSEVTLHEYAHTVIYELYMDKFIHTGIDPNTQPQRYAEAYAMDEGFSDYFTVDKTNHPTFGGPQANADPAAPSGAGVTVRFHWNYCDMNDFNDEPSGCGGDEHYRGRIISGAVWKIRSYGQMKSSWASAP